MLIYEVSHPEDPTRTVKYQVNAFDELKLNKKRRSSSNSSRSRRRITGAFLGLKPASHFNNDLNQDRVVDDQSPGVDNSAGNLADLVSSFYKTAKDDSTLL